jgi:hypothetical protein
LQQQLPAILAGLTPFPLGDVVHQQQEQAPLQARSVPRESPSRTHVLRRRETPPGKGGVDARAAAIEQMKKTLRAAQAAYRRDYGGPARKELRQRLLRELRQRARGDNDDAYDDLRTNADTKQPKQGGGRSVSAENSDQSPAANAVSPPSAAASASSSAPRGPAAGDVVSQAAEAEAAETAAAAAEEERARFDAIRKDALAWVRFRRTGKLPERAYSAGMDLRARGPNAAKPVEWLRYLSPAQLERYSAGHADKAEYLRLGLNDPAMREAWLAHDDAQGTRRARFKRMHAAYNEYKKLNAYAARQKRKAAGVGAGEEVGSWQGGGGGGGGGGSGAWPGPDVGEGSGGGSGATQRRNSDWLRYLSHDQRERVAAVRGGMAEYLNLRLNNPASREAWLAQDDALGTRRRRYEELRLEYNEYKRLHGLATREKKYWGTQAARWGPVKSAASAARAMGRGQQAAELPWFRYLTPAERQRVVEMRDDMKEYVRRGLNRQGAREAWLAEDDDEEGSRRALYERLHKAYNDYWRMYSRATREKERLAQGRPPPASGLDAGWRNRPDSSRPSIDVGYGEQRGDGGGSHLDGADEGDTTLFRHIHVPSKADLGKTWSQVAGHIARASGSFFNGDQQVPNPTRRPVPFSRRAAAAGGRLF